MHSGFKHSEHLKNLKKLPNQIQLLHTELLNSTIKTSF